MEEIIIQNARDYAALHNLQLTERLGFGIHGIIFVSENNSKAGKTAIKAHRYEEPYFREKAVYERLQEAEIREILGFNVPQMFRFDDGLRVIEMSVVTRPFVLDFAGAYLDFMPEFSEEIWAEWETEKKDQFGSRWSKIEAALTALRSLDIYMVDVSPSNIAFLE